MDIKYLKPKQGAIVRDPMSKVPLAPDGEWKPWDSYWRRRFSDGSVEIIEPETKINVVETKVEKKSLFKKEESK